MPEKRLRPLVNAAAADNWTEKHRPQSLNDVVGNGKAIADLLAWANEWKDGAMPKERAVVLAGEPGVGKTTSAHALARDMDWGVVEMNASDARNEDAVHRIATTGAMNTAFTATGEFRSQAEGGHQLVILDEADNLFGREDRGGMKAIIETIRKTRQPIILIVNDLYELQRKGAALRTLARTIKFTRVHTRSIPKAMRNIAQAEGIALEAGVPEALAERAGGDLRGAVNDLQALAFGRDRILVSDVEALGNRDKTHDVWELLGKVFYGKSLDEPRKMAWDVDVTPDTLALWIDENLPIFYQNRADLVDGYAALSRADMYLGRTLRRQHFALWSYASTMMTSGVSLAKVEPAARARFAFPSWLSKQSRSRKVRSVRDSLASKVGEYTHTSKNRARQDFFPMLKQMVANDDQYAAWAVHAFGLDAEELAFLLESKPTTAKLKKIMVAAEDMGPRPVITKAGGLGGFDDDEGETDVSADEPVVAEKPKKQQAAAAAKKSPRKEAPIAAPEEPAAEKEPAKDEDEGPKSQKSLFDF